MDAVILAAGRNDRLAGLVAEGMKPLLLVNGRPIIVDLMKKISIASEHRRVPVTIVASPVNVMAIVSVLKANAMLWRDLQIVIQPEPTGPVDALRRGFRARLGRSNSDTTLVLCGDNVVPLETMQTFIQGGDAYDDKFAGWVAVKKMDDELAAGRFTRVAEDAREFREGIQPGGMWRDGKYRAWLGPVLTYSEYLRLFFESPAKSDSEVVQLSRVWERVVHIHGVTSSKWFLVDAKCEDIGVPEELQ
jgi:NDP-sugar pyrophosphorylase family protein